MWKRHAGFDVVTYTGSGVYSGEEQDIFHSLNAVPEMMWVKRRDASGADWMVYHKGLNGGTNPEQYRLKLNSSDSESSYDCWDQTAPTAIKFRVGDQTETNQENATYIAMLFASVDGISKVGSYSGTGNAISVTTGFAPRFVIIKNITEANGWYVLDTTRGWSSGNDNFLKLDETTAQSAYDFGAPTSTGFDLSAVTNAAHNKPGCTFIYYAHS
tara:strand:- start:39 stop:680 length:642 start_codon:yes stop_codon:yes gene_type:complete